MLPTLSAMARRNQAQGDLFSTTPAQRDLFDADPEADRKRAELQAYLFDHMRREMDAIDAKLAAAKDVFPFRDYGEALMTELSYKHWCAQLPEGEERYARFLVEMQRVYDIENRRLGYLDDDEGKEG